MHILSKHMYYRQELVSYSESRIVISNVKLIHVLLYAYLVSLAIFMGEQFNNNVPTVF